MKYKRTISIEMSLKIPISIVIGIEHSNDFVGKF